METVKALWGKLLEVSGTKDTHYCEVIRTDSERDFITSIKMPIHTKIEEFSLDYNDIIHNGTLITFPGIIHLIVDSTKISFWQKWKIQPVFNKENK